MSEWNGLVLHDSLPDGRNPATLHIAEPYIVARCDNGKDFQIDLRTVRFDIRGAGKKAYFFESDEPNSPTISCRQEAMMEDLKKVSLKEFQAILQRTLGGEKTKWFNTYLLPVGVLGGLLFFSVIFAFFILPNIVLRFIPTSVDVQFGDAALPSVLMQISPGKKEVKDKYVQKEVDQIVGRLLKGLDKNDFKFRVHILDTPMVNAFALPGGHMVVTTGILSKMGSAEELAGVMAHEISHVTQRHSVRSLVVKAGIALMIQAWIGNPQGISGFLVSNAGKLGELGYSRGMESESDREGLKLLKKTGISPKGFKEFLLRIKKLHKGKEAGGVLKFLSTHPATDDRIKTLDKIVRKAGPYQVSLLKTDWTKLQSYVRNKYNLKKKKKPQQRQLTQPKPRPDAESVKKSKPANR